MKKAILLLLALSLVAGLIFIIGCSDDDDNGTGSIPKQTGDMNDPLFLAAWEPIEESSAAVPEGLGVMMNFLWGVMDSAAVLGKGIELRGLGAAEPDTVWYDPITKYWHAEGEDSYINWNEYERDSAQFMHGAIAVQWPDTLLLTRINGGSHFINTYTSDIKEGDSPNAVDTAFEFSFSGYMAGEAGQIWDMGDITAGGTGMIHMTPEVPKSPEEIYCLYDIVDHFTATNVQINILDMMMGTCPEAGSITHFYDLTLDCEGDTVFTYTGSWYMQETFAGEMVHYIVENELYRWEFSEPCYIITK
jgi:hypothetical protein